MLTYVCVFMRKPTPTVLFAYGAGSSNRHMHSAHGKMHICSAGSRTSQVYTLCISYNIKHYISCTSYISCISYSSKHVRFAAQRASRKITGRQLSNTQIDIIYGAPCLRSLPYLNLNSDSSAVLFPHKATLTGMPIAHGHASREQRRGFSHPGVPGLSPYSRDQI